MVGVGEVVGAGEMMGDGQVMGDGPDGEVTSARV